MRNARLGQHESVGSYSVRRVTCLGIDGVADMGVRHRTEVSGAVRGDGDMGIGGSHR